MKIRPIQPEDAKQFMDLGIRFHKESPFHSRYEFDMEKAFNFMVDLSLRDSACMYICENGSDEIVGFIGGELRSSYYTQDKTANEVIFFVDPKHRGGRAAVLLIQTFEKWAKEHNAKNMEFGVVTAIHPEKTDNFFKRYGFRYLGGNFYKEVV